MPVWLNLTPLGALALLLQGCSLTPELPEHFLARHGVSPPDNGQIQVCSAVGCRRQVRFVYSPRAWSPIVALFAPPPADPGAERQRVRAAVALIEALVATHAGTAGDRARNDGWFTQDPQLDCVAETANTTVALLLLQQRGWLRHHRVGTPVHRGLFDGLAPHNTAVLVETASQHRFAVDAWFFANGQAPVVVPLEQWQAGYEPKAP